MKVVVLGIQNVGKTAILHRYVTNDFNPYLGQTMIAATLQKRIENEAGTVIMDLWDTAGQEKFRSLTPQYIRGSKAAIVVASADNVASIKEIPYLMNMIEGTASEDIKVCAVLNKMDLAEEAQQVSKDLFYKTIESLNKNRTPGIFTVSAKTGAGINMLFDYIIAQTSSAEHVSDQTSAIHLKGRSEKKNNCC